MYARANDTSASRLKLKSLRKTRLDFNDKFIQNINFDAKTESFEYNAKIAKDILADCCNIIGKPSSIVPFCGILEMVLAAVYTTALYAQRSNSAEITSFVLNRDLKFTNYELSLKCIVNLETGQAKLLANDNDESHFESIATFKAMFSNAGAQASSSTVSCTTHSIVAGQEASLSGSFLIPPRIIEAILGACGFSSFSEADRIYLDRECANSLRVDSTEIVCTSDHLDNDKVHLSAKVDGKTLMTIVLNNTNERSTSIVMMDSTPLSAVHILQSEWLPSSGLKDQLTIPNQPIVFVGEALSVLKKPGSPDAFYTLKDLQSKPNLDFTLNGKTARHVIFVIPPSMLVQADPQNVTSDGDVQVWDFLSALSFLSSRCKHLLVVLTQAWDTSIPFSGAVSCALMEFPQTKIKLLTASNECGSSPVDLKALRTVIDREIAHWDQESNVEMQYTYSDQHDWTRRTNTFSNLSLYSSSTSMLDSRKTEGAVIVTGGLGGLGLVTADILLRVGWSKIVLVSRTGAVSYTGQGLEDMLNSLMKNNGTTSASGAMIEVVIIKCDVSIESEVVRLLEEVRSRFTRIGGLVHAAGVAKDCALKNIHLFKKSVTAVWQSKALSCSLLTKHTSSDNLSLFVVYSSIAAAVGNAGQASYCVANKFIEELVKQRSSDSCKAIAIQWPAIAGVGMAAALAAKIAKLNAARGDKSTATAPSSEFEIDAECVSCLLLSLFNTAALARGTVTVIPKTAVAILASTAYARPICDAIENLKQSMVAPHLDSTLDKQMLKDAQVKPIEGSSKTISGPKLSSRIGEMTERIIGFPVDSKQPLMTQGMDSLGISELAILLNTEFALNLDSTFIFNHPTIESICFMIEASQKPSPVHATDEPKLVTVLPSTARLPEVGVVGIACRFPGDIDSLPLLWDCLKNGHNLATTQKDRWDLKAVIQCVGDTANNVHLLERINRACFMSDVALHSFNFAGFNIPFTEAEQMDLTQRHLLQISYEALMDSQISLDTARSKLTGVFVAASAITTSMNYGFTQGSDDVSTFDATKNTLSVAAGRISFALGLRGPALAIDTACSSSLVALHTARRSLQLRECDIAIVASANIIDLESSVKIAMAGMLSSTGICATYDSSADGYGRGEGCGAVVLIRMDDTDSALSSMMSYANLAGSAVMQDGQSASLTAPNGLAQQDLIRAALVDAKLNPVDVSFIESHGTGTKLGDPVETTALAAVFGTATASDTPARRTPLYVTGIKANVGHLEAAAGMAGLFSAIVSLQHGEVPPNGQLKEINASVIKSIQGSNIKVLNVPTVLPDNASVAGISSFAYSGTIAHVIVKRPCADNVRSISSNATEAVKKFRQGQHSMTKRYALLKTQPSTIPQQGKVSRTIDEVQNTVQQVVLSMIGSEYHNDYSADAPLLEIGVDSMGASEIVLQLEKLLNVKDLPGTLIFLCPTVSSIAKYIFDKHLPQDTASVHVPQAESSFATSGQVAIVGLSLHLGEDVNSLDKLWNLLRNKKSNLSKTKWDTKPALQALGMHQNHSVVDRLKTAHYASFESWNHSDFGITANEAKGIPQIQKVLLSMVKKALLDANYDFTNPSTKNIGIFVGACGFHGSFPSLNSRNQKNTGYTATTATSNSLSVSAGRISYTFGFTGPCMTIDTACSSSLVAIHSARRSLQMNECDLAVVCSANILDLESSIAVAVAGMTSRTGRCHTFDQNADGYSRGEGAGAIVLQKVDDALRGEVESYATIVGSAVQQDGRSASLTAPNASAQENVIRMSLKESGLTPSEISFIESHGTGTKLGDPVETTALAAVFGTATASDTPARRTPLYVTGIKANVGHLEAAAGMAGLFSAIVSLQHGEVPPNGQLNQLNTEVQRSVKGTPIVFPTSPQTLSRDNESLIAGGVSSFGFSGTIAHVILQETPQKSRRKIPVTAVSSPLSAFTFTDSEEGTMVPAESDNKESSELNQTVWQFTGQGKLTVNCAREIHDSEAAFRTALAKCDQILKTLLKYSASELLYPDTVTNGLTTDEAQKLLDETQYLQPVLVALEFCLAAVWLDQGMKPWAVVGHSIGEYAASVVAGVMTLEDCLMLVCTRGRLTQELHSTTQGSMYALRAPQSTAAEAIAKANTTGSVAIAAVNGAQSIVISGSTKNVEKTLAMLPANAGKVKLGVSYGFHSPVMQGVIPQYSTALQNVRLTMPKVHFFSTVRGRVVIKEVLQNQYWLDHIMHCVRYKDAIEESWALGGRTFIEVGPNSTLTKLTKGILTGKGVNKEEYTVLSSLE